MLLLAYCFRRNLVQVRGLFAEVERGLVEVFAARRCRATPPRDREWDERVLLAGARVPGREAGSSTSIHANEQETLAGDPWPALRSE